MKGRRPVILILGPTAGGKTAVAVELAKALPGGGECISADSMQVYRGMDIGTAKPTVAERQAAVHHLVDIADPIDDSFSVDRWLELATQVIEDIRARGRWPIVVGGTNLYVQALLHGLADMPEPDPALRARLAALDLDELRTMLERIDPAAALRIHRNDRKRTTRAIEVFEATGQRLSEMQTQWAGEARVGGERASPTDLLIIGLEYPVQEINRRINARVKAMIEQGLVEETRQLYEARGLGRNAREALGYKQIIDHLDGRLSLEEAIEQIKIRTRRYAKQQRTWLRRFRAYPDALWIEAADKTAQELASEALTFIASHGQTAAQTSVNAHRR